MKRKKVISYQSSFSNQQLAISNRNWLVKLFVLIFTFNFLLLTFNSFSQVGVGINTNGAAANPAALLDVSSTTQGLLVPRMNTTQRDAIATPIPHSLLIFNTTTNCFEAWNQAASSWSAFGCFVCPIPATPGAITGASSICENQSGVVYSISAVSGATSYTWSVPASATITAQATTICTVTFGTAGTVNISVTANNACGNSAAQTNAVTVNALPTITGTTPASRCGTGTVALGATTSAGTINWWLASSGGSSQGTGTSWTTPGISSTTQYWVDATANGCTTASRTSVTATVTANLSAVNITPSGDQSICASGTGSTGTQLTASETGGGTISARQWKYGTASGGPYNTNIGTNSQYYTPTGSDLGGVTRYVVCVSTPTCGSAMTSNQVTVTVTAILSSVSISPSTAQSFCTTGTGSLLTASETNGGTITSRSWGKRSVSLGTITPISGATAQTYTPTASLGLGTWYIVCTSTPSCGSAMVSNEVTVNVTAGCPCSWNGLTTFTVTHTAGVNGAPVTKTVTYNQIQTSISGASKCWITQNLGADNQAATATDGSEAAAGWYFQFNRAQGYKSNECDLPTPSTWNTAFITDNLNWSSANDPCPAMLGAGWRLPNSTEWTNADATGGWNNYNDTWNSVLKLHAAGFLAANNGVPNNRKESCTIVYTVSAMYCSSDQNPTPTVPGEWRQSYILDAEIGTSSVYITGKANGLPVRCIKD